MFGGTYAFGGTTSYSERAKYILKDALIIIVAFQAAQRTLGINFLDAIFGILFIFVPPNKRLDPVFCSIRKWLISGLAMALNAVTNVCSI